ncbi:MAG TPA: LPS export ABC transporter periplasmic protein LptC [Dongiaceae bacterium]|nr:LPS export ABC transporter periplasmic protein LptC [Dongiaceae bacterium]
MIAAIAGITVVVLRSGPRESEPLRSASQQLPQNIDVALKKARFQEIQDGLVVWELVAESVNYDKGEDRANLSNIRMEFQRNRSHGAVTVTADNGEFSSEAKIVRLNGHVHVITEDGASFKTDSIVYTGATAKFSTADPVIFRQQRLQLNAVGMDLNIKNQKSHFLSLVDASIISK